MLLLPSHSLGKQEASLRRLCMMSFLVVSLGLREAQGHEIFGSTAMDFLKGLPEVGRALKNTLQAALAPIFQPRGATAQSRAGTAGDGSHTYCYGELGCIAMSRDFYHPIHRPINLAPGKREDVRVTFTIKSKEDPVGVAVPWNDVRKAKESSFKPSRKTKVIIHGFMNGRDMPFMEDMSKAFLSNYDVNIIWIDWTDGSLVLYNRAVANSLLVSLEITHFLKWLRDNMGLNPADIHLIGHSLGSHIAGYVGEKIPGLGRITGLDPAEPFFQHLPSTVRLDPSDANFVDVIHTDSDSIFNIGQGFGLRQPVGHVDFYPNDGKRQPGCEAPLAVPFRRMSRKTSLKNVWNAVENMIGCNHKRAVELFTDSIKSQCPYMAFHCDSYEDYMSGKCLSCGVDGTGCALMGLHADTWRGAGTGKELVQLFTSAGTAPNFCRYHYQIVVELGDLPGTERDRLGKLYTTFIDGDGRKMTFDLTSKHPKQFTSRSHHSFFVENEENFGDVREVEVKWAMERRGSQSTQTSLSLQKLAIRNVDTYPLKESVSRQGRSESTFFFCEKYGAPVMIADQETVTLKASSSCFGSG
ncbi:pancreatic triacylglycerol lipase-like [Macrobrachium nipponense]|uniref:pancreatic triacylglycerol lipase-like n=1 Tax=Macrobrachium nipponense TaxID=159736 RepID=UPI0030C896E4